jgi:hypothetical protein
MFDITCSSGLLRIDRQIRHGANSELNMVIDLKPGHKIDQTVSKVDILWSWYEENLVERAEEERLRKENPALQDAWEKYQIIKTLVTKDGT